MFTVQLEQIFTQEKLQEAFLEISSKSTGLDEVSYSAFKDDFAHNIQESITSIVTGAYSPEPLKKIEIDKPNSHEKRPIASTTKKDKLIKKLLNGVFIKYF